MQHAFDALADGTRRDILSLLRRGDLTAGAIAEAFPAISRPAVSRHLRVLRESGLAGTTRHGREWRYRIDERAIAALYHDWFAQFAPLWDQALRNLKERTEARP